MREEKWYDVPGRFLRQHGKTGIFFLVYCVIFAGIFILYDLEAEAVLYHKTICEFMPNNPAAFLWRYESL